MQIKRNYGGGFFELGFAEFSMCNKVASIDAFEKAKKDKNYRQNAKYYLDKIDNFSYQIVGEKENPEFVILTNRILTYYNSKNSDLKTCFDKHKGKILEKVTRNGLTLSAIKEFN